METIRAVLAATDFSSDARNAAARAALIAAEQQAELRLLHVMNGPSFKSLHNVFHPAAEVESRLLEDARRALGEIAAEVAVEGLGDPITRVQVGVVLDEILAAAREADLLVLGPRGSNPLRDLILGTTAERLLRKCRRPVLVTKCAPRGSYRNVLVPVDFSLHSEAALRSAAAIAPKAAITVFHAFEVPFEGKLRFAGVSDASIHDYRTRARKQARAEMNRLVDTAGGAPVSSVIDHGEAPRLILEREEMAHTDLIIMGKHGQSAVEELFLGSVTRHILSDAKCDVLVVPEGGQPPR